MDLFPSERFTGSDGATDASSSTNNLELLYQKIEARKKLKEGTGTIGLEDKCPTTVIKKSRLIKKYGIKESPLLDISTPFEVFNSCLNKRRHEPSDCETGGSHKQKLTKKDTKLVNDSNSAQKTISAVEGNNCDASLLSCKLGVEQNEDGATPAPDSHASFTVIGDMEFSALKKINRSLPSWIAEPHYIPLDLHNNRVKLKAARVINKSLRSLLRKNGLTSLFPVQHQVIPWLLNVYNKTKGVRSVYSPVRDVCVCAPTGSGKTLAYVLPIVQVLLPRLVPRVRALIVLPVQELALQVADVFKAYCSGTKLRVGMAVGGKESLGVEISKLRKVVKTADHVEYESLVDILVTTPGRLVEHLEHSEGFSLKSLQFLVMDEADRLIENYRNDWLYMLEKHLQKDKVPLHLLTVRSCSERLHMPQKLLFSATLTQDPEKLKFVHLFQPILFMSSENDHSLGDSAGGSCGPPAKRYSTPTDLKEFYIVAETSVKPLYIQELLIRGWDRILCFTKSSSDASRLTTILSHLNPGKTFSELSSQIPSNQRCRILNSFAEGSISVLVCSDRMARGMDIQGVDYVISYDPPKFIKGYIHRAGRTGRAGIPGTALTIVTQSQLPGFQNMLSQAGKDDVKVMNMKLDDNLYRKYTRALKRLKIQTMVEKRNKIRLMKKSKRGHLALRKKAKAN